MISNCKGRLSILSLRELACPERSRRVHPLYGVYSNLSNSSIISIQSVPIAPGLHRITRCPRDRRPTTEDGGRFTTFRFFNPVSRLLSSVGNEATSHPVFRPRSSVGRAATIKSTGLATRYHDFVGKVMCVLNKNNYQK